MRHRSSALIAALLVTVAAGGCTSPELGDQSLSRMVTIGGRDLNCYEKKAVVVGTTFLDIDHDRVDEAFVTMKCPTKNPKEPGQLEVFRLNLQGGEPELLGVMIRNRQNIILENCVLYAGKQELLIRGGRNGTTVVWSVRWTGPGEKSELKSSELKNPPRTPTCG